MLISLAEVRSTFDPKRNNAFLCKIQSLGDAEKSVKWTSPYATGGNGTLTTPPPPPGTMILVTQPDGCGDWYYMASTFSEEPTIAESEQVGSEGGTGEGTMKGVKVSPAQRNENQERYSQSTGRPETITIKGDSGAGMDVTNLRSKKAQHLGVRLFTERGKVISMNDAPNVDTIKISTSHGSKNEEGICTLTLGDACDHPNNLAQPYFATLLTTGFQNFWCIESGIDMRVLDGLECDIRNGSFGTNKNPDEPDKWGNVTVQSDFKDVNIFAQDSTGEGARIFIECLNEDGSNQVIQIQTNGEGGAIRIKTKGKVDIEAENIGINAENQIDIKAGGNISLQAGGEFSIKADGNIAADGSEVHLNSGLSLPATPDIGNDESYYENMGLVL
jgi:hypothetical protein